MRPARQCTLFGKAFCITVLFAFGDPKTVGFVELSYCLGVSKVAWSNMAPYPLHVTWSNMATFIQSKEEWRGYL